MNPRTETRIASIYIDQNDILNIVMKDCGLVDQYDVLDLNLAIRHMADGKSYLKLFDATGDWDMSKEAKLMATKEDKLSKSIARAVVVSNSVKSSLANFLHQFKDKPFPHQFFHDRETAEKWLLSLKNQ